MTNLITGIVIFLLSKEFIITNDSFIITGIFISLLVFMVYSFRTFIIETNNSIRQQLITALIQENLSLKHSLLLHDSFNCLRSDLVSLDEMVFDLPHDLIEQNNIDSLSY